ncbi:hypothetical protein Patl1_27840 [Pistacia atlantica]|uniref:Uncharacterized protein n=1 Tax=Pistacia atlantica TaxID=434234 RepID=A0ACC1BHB6_9ROSI|nr:hypothetical protein Patl1_27840 [Pistacia atlantica]
MNSGCRGRRGWGFCREEVDELGGGGGRGFGCPNRPKSDKERLHDVIAVAGEQRVQCREKGLGFDGGTPGVLLVQNQNPCSFNGIKCNETRVSSIDLTSLHLDTDFHLVAYLLTLENLQTLSLQNTNLSGTISLTLGSKCSSYLTSIDLSHNSLSGPLSVLSNLGSCSSLKSLNLSSNLLAFSGEESGVLKLSLESLDLSYNYQISGPNFVPWIVYNGCEDLKLLALKALEHLDISANKFSFDIVHAISPCEKLTFLNISGNQFGGQVPVLSSAANLQFFLLGNNLFQGEIPVQLADSWTRSIFLRIICELPVDTFLQMSSLKELVLSFNDFTGVLPHSLSELTNLETLDLSSNNFSGLIPANLCRHPGNSLKDIPSSLGALSELQDLNLWLNNLRGEIPQELGNIQTLQTLILDFNQLSGPVPSSLSNCTNLTWISLSNDQLSGEIPRWISELSNLAILKLNNNSFYGSIPLELGDCRNLIWLDLNTNNLNGSIPPALFKQSGKIAVNFIAGKIYVYIKNDGSKECHGAGNLLSLEELDRSS